MLLRIYNSVTGKYYDIRECSSNKKHPPKVLISLWDTSSNKNTKTE
jgi:hypothetical protein